LSLAVDDVAEGRQEVDAPVFEHGSKVAPKDRLRHAVPALVKAIDNRAAAEGISRADVIRKAVKRYLGLDD